MKKINRKVIPPTVKKKISEMKSRCLELMKEKETLTNEIDSYVERIEKSRNRIVKPSNIQDATPMMNQLKINHEHNLQLLDIEITHNKFLKYKIEQIKQELAKPAPLDVFDYKSLEEDEKLVSEYTALMNDYVLPPEYPSNNWIQDTSKKLVLNEPPSFSDDYDDILVQLHSFRNNFHELNLEEKRCSIADAKNAQSLMQNITKSYSRAKLFGDFKDSKIQRTQYKKQCITDFNTLRLSVQRIFH